MMLVYLSLLVLFLITSVVVVARLGRSLQRPKRSPGPTIIVSPTDGSRTGPRVLPAPARSSTELDSVSSTSDALVPTEDVRAEFTPGLLQFDRSAFGVLGTGLTKRRLNSSAEVVCSATRVTKELGNLANSELDNQIQFRARKLHLKYQEEIARLDFELERAETELAVEVIRSKQRDLMSRIAELQRIGVVSR